MVTLKTPPPQHDPKCSVFSSSKPEACRLFSSQGAKIPTYFFGTQNLAGIGPFGELSHLSDGAKEHHTVLDSLLLAKWEDRMQKGHLRYDETTSEIKVIDGKRRFVGQLNCGCSMDSLEDCTEHRICSQCDLSLFDGVKHSEELLFCIANTDRAHSELTTSASVPNDAMLIIMNVNPIEYGHIFLLPCGLDGVSQVLDVRSMDILVRAAVEINNSSFRLFYDCFGPSASHLHFQACYFPDLLPVELMPIDTLFDDGGIHISTITDYPMKNLLFKSTCNFKMMVEVLSNMCLLLLDKSIPYNLLISDRGKKIFLFLQRQKLLTPCGLSAWECGGYFLFKSRKEFDQVTEVVLLKRLTTVSLDDEGFAMVKHLCRSTVSKFVV